jgi:hypothetical protein
MKFTPGQVREMLAISQDTYRHWKGAFPPLRGRNGYTACFTPGDLLALAAVKTLTEDVGIRVGNLGRVAVGLFEHCNRHSWAGLERSLLIIELMRARVTSAPEARPPPLDGLAIVLPLRPIVAALRGRLLLEQVEVQQEALRFPPTALTTTRRKEEAS